MGIHPRAAAPLSLRECKVRASFLLKDLLSADTARSARAAERLRAVPAFAALTAAEVLARRESVRRKHALALIAHEQGHASWVALRQALGEEASARLDTEAFFLKNRGAFLNRWFATYAEALVSLREKGGYLFPFREQFFICEAEFLRALGVDFKDPDWERMGFNWVEPLEPSARDRLEQKLTALGYTG
ncbi:hypothetical protein POL68_34980 [Stigmatella sp. ncwal1]|uniref:Uncharacterized protein n=1 Tax=Stigmatella ashevillensis TaxID=2995309 RepID=A0ABT5DL26_9BACT|nr:hypothetical protein [Stigmatella ashevillena]MDC0713724.1 hypothetical protein [Stigmatella ashevillena]